MARCQDVSSRFETHRRNNRLDFITAGYLNGQPAICVGNGNPPCTSEKLLFTLKPGSNAAARIQQLFNIRSGASSAPLYESTRESSGSAGSVVDFNQFLQQAPLEAGAAPASPGQPDATPPNQPAAPSGGLLF